MTTTENKSIKALRELMDYSPKKEIPAWYNPCVNALMKGSWDAVDKYCDNITDRDLYIISKLPDLNFELAREIIICSPNEERYHLRRIKNKPLMKSGWVSLFKRVNKDIAKLKGRDSAISHYKLYNKKCILPKIAV